MRFITEHDLGGYRRVLWTPSEMQGTNKCWCIWCYQEWAASQQQCLQTHCVKLGEAPHLWDVDLLAAREGKLGSRQSLSHMCPYSVAWCRWAWWPGQGEPWSPWPGASQGTMHTIRSQSDPGQNNILFIGTTSKGWKPSSLTTALTHRVFDGTDTGSLWGFGRAMLMFIWHHVATKWEFINFCLLLSQVIVDLDPRDTSAEVSPWTQFV